MTFLSRFIHVPRTGGKAIQKATLGKLGAYHKIHVGDGPCYAAVRNPYDRAVALCEMLCLKFLNYKERGTVEVTDLDPIIFQHWVKKGFNAFRGTGIQTMWHPGTEEEFMFSDTMLNYMRRNPKQHISDILKFETMAIDFDNLCTKSGFENKLNWENTPPDYKRFYDDETFTLVTEKYQADITEFGYTF